MRTTLSDLATAVANGQETSVRLVHEAHGRIEEPAGEGSRTYLKLYMNAALAVAQAI